MTSPETTKTDMESAVLNAVRQGKIKMRPRWQFTAQKISLESALLFFALASIMAGSFLLYYWQVSELQELSTFGLSATWEILINFPYELILIIILSIFIFNKIAKKLNWGYKITKLVWWSTAICFIVVSIFILAALQIHEAFHNYLNKSQYPIINSIYQNRLHNIKNNSQDGEIENVEENVITVTHFDPTSSTSFRSKIDLSKIKHHNTIFKKGDHVRMPSHSKNQAPWAIYHTK